MGGVTVVDWVISVGNGVHEVAEVSASWTGGLPSSAAKRNPQALLRTQRKHRRLEAGAARKVRMQYKAQALRKMNCTVSSIASHEHEPSFRILPVM